MPVDLLQQCARRSDSVEWLVEGAYGFSVADAGKQRFPLLEASAARERADGVCGQKHLLSVIQGLACGFNRPKSWQ